VLGLSLFRGGGKHRLRGRRGLAAVLALTAGAGLLTAAGVAAMARASSSTAQASTVTPASGELNTVLPERLLDTRTTTGGHHAKLGPGAIMTLPVLGQGGVPWAGVSAVLINVTAVNETSRTGYLTVYPTGMSRPISSSLNYVGNTAIANQSLVRVGSNGTVSIFNNAGSTDVIVDVQGWVSDDASTGNGQTTSGAPVRILDTRTTNGGHDAPLGYTQSLNLQVEGVGGIPAGVSAVWANVTAVPVGTSNGYLTAYPSGSALPVSSTVNFQPGVITATFALLPVSASGAITILNHSTKANVIVDVTGWLSGGDVTTDAGTQPITPVRVLDTRTTTGGHKAPVGPGGEVSAKVLGVGGVPATGVAAVVVHVTGTGATSNTYLVGSGTGLPKHGSSSLNLNGGTTASNNVTVPVGTDGAVSVYNYVGDVNVVIDVQGWIAAPVLTVVPPLASALGAGALTSSDGEQAAQILNNANRYAVTTWWNDVYPVLAAAPLHSEITSDDASAMADDAGTTSVSTWDNTRRITMEAYSLAISIATGAYNPGPAPAGTGVPTATATADAVKMIGLVAGAHLMNMPGGWGATTESTFYAAYIGTAAWLLWDDLSPAVQAEVAKVVYFEAEWGLDADTGIYANAAGTVVNPGNTDADGDSWLPMAAQLATVMMPTNAHVALWENVVVRDALIAWSRPSDLTNSTQVNGATVAQWIDDQGSNVLPGGDLINHNRFAPDYSSLIYQNMEDILVTALAGQSAPQAITTLVGPVYAAYTTVKYAAPPYDAHPAGDPDGTVYPPLNADSSTIYYPQGCDWGLGQEIPYALADAQTAAFGVVTGTAAQTAASYEALHAGKVLSEQQANADGSTYGTNTTLYTYQGREEHTAQMAGLLYLTMYVRDHSLSSFNENNDVLAP
jgi:hypothetical protein